MTLSYDTPQFWNFVRDHIHDNPKALRLKYHNRDADGDIDYPLAITQIECRGKFGSKLRETLRQDPEFVFANELAGEQSTSDALAGFHATLAADARHITDMTCGLGIDAMHLAAGGAEVTAIDCQEPLIKALKFNCSNLKIGNLTALCGDSVEMLRSGELNGDVLFIDPARRAADGSRVFSVDQCRPDVTALIPGIRRHFRTLVAKLSPMLDVTLTMRTFAPELTRICITGTRTECKELVCVADFGAETAEDECPIDCVTLSDGRTEIFRFTRAEESLSPVPKYATPAVGDVVYELWPAVIKAAPMKTLCARFPGLHKLSANTHIFFSSDKIDDVPAETRTIEAIIPWQSKNLKRLKSLYPVIDIAVRNFGMTAAELQKKLGTRQGGERRLLAVTDSHGSRLLLILKR